MKKRMKRLIAAMLVFVFLFTTACGSNDAKNSDVPALGDVTEIPEGGVITKEQFATVAGENKIIKFTGSGEEGISYTWSFQAAQIQNPTDQNLKAEFTMEGLADLMKQVDGAAEAVKLTMPGGGVIAVPDLTVTVPAVWTSTEVKLYKIENGSLTEINDAQVQPDSSTGSTAITVKINSLDGEYILIGTGSAGNTEETTTATEAETTTEKKEETTTEKKSETTTTKRSETTTVKKSETTTAKKSETTTAKKSETTTEKKSETTTEKKSETTTTKRSETTTVKKSETTTAKKSETTTAKKSETTTAKKSETTTEKKEETKTEEKKLTCTISISCKTLLDNMDQLEKEKHDFVPSDGWILSKTKVTFEEGESVHDILKRVCKSKGIHMESSYTPMYDSAYVEGINQLYEFDGGSLSGWMYKVNGWFPNYGCSKYTVNEGDKIEWVYTCDLGADVGDNSMGFQGQ